MARALRAWAINQGGKNSVRNLRYGPRTRLVRGIYLFWPCSYSRSRTGTNLQLRLMRRVFKCKRHSSLFHDIPHMKPLLQASSSPTDTENMEMFYSWLALSRYKKIHSHSMTYLTSPN